MLVTVFEYGSRVVLNILAFEHEEYAGKTLINFGHISIEIK